MKDDIAERFSDEEATTFYEAIVRVRNARRNAASVGGVDYDARPALLNVPAPFFLDALEYVVSQATGTYGAYGLPGYTQADAIHEINRQFAVRGVWFEMSANGRAEWHGDQHIFTEILAPALAALDDPRLSAPRQEYDDALRGLRQGGRVGEKNAIRDSSNAVE